MTICWIILYFTRLLDCCLGLGKPSSDIFVTFVPLDVWKPIIVCKKKNKWMMKVVLLSSQFVAYFFFCWVTNL